MSDLKDPYDTPPAPERFDPPRRESGEPLVPEPGTQEAYTAPTPLEPSPMVPSPVQEPPVYSAAPTGDTQIHASDESSPFAVPPSTSVEPLPIAAGHFGSGHDAGGAGDGASLSSRLVDEFVAWLKTLASAAVYATLIVTFGFQVARVEGQSMAPTLEDQDRLIVNKLAYRLGDPQVGDIVMLYYPLNPDKSFVKRVIAEPGDQIRIVDGKVYRNDVLMDDSFVPPEFRSHDDLAPKIIDEGYYFVMGDHRNNSSDSRHWGLVPKKYIIGRVQLRWWPVPEARTF